MVTERKAPKLRFKGFTNDWKQINFKNLVTMHARIGWQGLRRSEFRPSGNIYIITGTDFKNGSINFEKASFIGKDRYDQDKHIQLKNNDILITKDGTIGKVAYVVKLPKPATLNAGIYVIRPKAKNLDRRYLFQFLSTNRLIKYAKQNATGGTIKHLNENILVSFPIQISSFREENQISKLLDKIDLIITLQQRKLDQLKKLKKGFLQKLFSNESSLNPEIRFNGFIDKWSQNQLSKYLITSKEINSNNSFNKYDILSVSGDYGVVNQIAFQGRSFAGKSLIKYRILNPGEIVYTKSPLKKSPYGIVKDNKFKRGIVSSLYAVYKIRKYVNANFIEYYFSDQLRLNKYLKPIVNIGAKHTIQVSDDGALKGEVQFPSFAEQRKIAQFLQKLDDQIHLQEKKYDYLNQFKKFLLQNMFI